MPRNGEGKRPMTDLLTLLRPSYTEEEQLTAKQMQRGYKAVRDQMRAHERLVVTSHGHPEAVMLPYQKVKMLWQMINELLEQAENNHLISLAAERLTNQRSERVPLDKGLAEMRKAMLGPSAE